MIRKAPAFERRLPGLAKGAALVCLLCALIPRGAMAEERAPRPLSFFAAAEPAEVELGRPFTLRVEVRHPLAERYRLPSDLDLDPAEPLDRHEEWSEEEGSAKTTFTVGLVIYDTLGEVALPDLVLEAEDDEGKLSPLRIPGATIRILETGTGTELEPPPAPLPVRVFAWERLALFAGGLALLLALVFLLRRRRKAGPASEVPRPSPVEEAEQALAALRAAALWEKGEARRHYFRLSEILRLYLRDARGLAAVEMTSDELLAALRRRPVAGLSFPEVEVWIRRGDLARFAKGKVEGEQALADLEALARMIAAMEAAQAQAQAQAAGGEGP